MIVIREDLCPQNHPCPVIRLCPVDAITQEGFNAPEVNDAQCICCCKCTSACAVFTPVRCCKEGTDQRMV